jgi:hypothetical protein
MRAAQSKRKKHPLAPVPVKVYDDYTKKVTIYPTILEAAKALNVNSGTIHRKINSSTTKSYKNRYYISKFLISKQSSHPLTSTRYFRKYILPTTLSVWVSGVLDQIFQNKYNVSPSLIKTLHVNTYFINLELQQKIKNILNSIKKNILLKFTLILLALSLLLYNLVNRKEQIALYVDDISDNVELEEIYLTSDDLQFLPTQIDYNVIIKDYNLHLKNNHLKNYSIIDNTKN